MGQKKGEDNSTMCVKGQIKIANACFQGSTFQIVQVRKVTKVPNVIRV